MILKIVFFTIVMGVKH